MQTLHLPLKRRGSILTVLQTLLILPPIQYQKGFYRRRSSTSFKNQLSQRISINTNEILSRESVTEAPTALVHNILAEVQFSYRTEAHRNKTKKAKEVLSFVTTPNPATSNLKKILIEHWHIIQQQPKLGHIFNQPLIKSFRKENSLKPSRTF